MASIHVYPVDRLHNTDSQDCWCEPDLLIPCSEGEGGLSKDAHRGCWKCAGLGLVLAPASEDNLVIVHHDPSDIEACIYCGRQEH